ncbi:unnamed protein product [Auanema sp. JU1783]|nr:unnamed protein product [Auanema sp. JU1783]
MKSFLHRPTTEERMENLRFLPDPNDNNPFRLSNKGGAYGSPKSNKGKADSPPVSRDQDDDRQVVAGIPDLSDPCFRRYANCIVVNAQPYERRSSTSLIKCKSHCLHSQSGVYSCRSFVFDNINQVCDLFAHVGDQSPARLLKFQTRDYFEPTSAIQCLDNNETDDFAIPELAVRALEADKAPIHSTAITSKVSTEPFGQQCPIGKKAGFLRTEGFELFKHDDLTLQVENVDECTVACEANEINGERLDCRSFDFSLKTCAFTKEAAVPVGEGQLKQKSDSFYYEKICISEKFTNQCKSSFARFPQMILVGFAENVADSSSFEQCFDNCLNSFHLYGFNCTSGMFYFEESNLNCILNTENRRTYPDLFTEENTDIVDYFEIDCGRTASTNFDENRSEKLVLADETETEWTDCDDGIQHRRRDCDKEKSNCGLESRSCDHGTTSSKAATTTITTSQSSTAAPQLASEKAIDSKLPNRQDILALKKRLLATGFECPKNQCCNVFNMCSVGLRHNLQTKQLEYCKTPCEVQ